MKKQRMIGVALLSLIGVMIGAVVVVDRSESSAGFAQLSAPTREVALATRRGRTADLLAIRRNRAFYSRTSAGRFCFGKGQLNARGEISPGTEACAADKVFPSASRPVLGTMGVQIDKNDPARVLITSLDGFAADGVVDVDLVGPSGSVVAQDRVVSNTFVLEVAGMILDRRYVLLARDGDGNVVHEESFGPRGVS